MRDRALHEHVRGEIERRLGPRSWNWLADQAGVPRSTLATQRLKPRFSLTVIVRVASVLDIPVQVLLPPIERPQTANPIAVLRRIERLARAAADRHPGRSGRMSE